jgi:hypothetical protein
MKHSSSTYMRLSLCRIGLLINFNTVSLTDGHQTPRAMTVKVKPPIR